MRLPKLLVSFVSSPAFFLLLSPHAPFIIYFIDRQFKLPGKIAIPHTELLAALHAYQEDLEQGHPGFLSGKAETYLSDWCSRETRWLQRFLEAGRDEPVYQLTPHTEDVFVFLDRVLEKDLGFVGTESRLKLVIDTLADLAIGSSDDSQTRLRHLREQQQRIQNEIDSIEADGRITRYQPAQIRERFATAVSLLRQLQGDFRAVEDSFREITAQVQQRQVGGFEARGKILGFALDAEDLLKQEDQGVSFYEFVRLILSPSQTERLQKLIREVRRIPELQRQHDGMETVRGMVTLLQNEAEKVMRTNQRLSATLRRLLDARTHAERLRITGLLKEIQQLASSLAGEAELEDAGLSLDLATSVENPMRRAFWAEPPRFEAVDLTGFEPEDDERMRAFQQLAAFRGLDWREMRDRIRHMLAVEHAPTLRDLLEMHPPEAGIVEVVGYVQIASEDGHLIDHRTHETLVVPGTNSSSRAMLVTVPRVTFLPERINGHAR